MNTGFWVSLGIRSLLAIFVAWLCSSSLSGQSKKVEALDLLQKLRLIKVIDARLDKYGHIYFSKNGKRIVTRGDLYGLRIFNAENGQLETAVSPCNGKKFTTVPFTADERLMAVGCYDRLTAEIWSLRSARKIRQFDVLPKADTTIATVSPDGARVVIHDAHQEPTELWHIEAATRIASLAPFLTKGSLHAHAVLFSPDSSVVAVSYNADLYLWEAQTGKMLFHLLDSAKNLKLPGATQAAHRNIIYDLLFSHDGKYLLSGSIDTKVKLWNVSAGKLMRTFSGHEGRIESLALSPNGKILATGSYDEKAKLWDVETGKLLWTSPSHKRFVWKIVFSPDGKRFITMTEKEIRMWETASGKLLGKMPSVFWQSFFSPDWKRFVTTGKNKGTIELYEVVE